MRQRKYLDRVVVRYSEAFKLAVVREIEQGLNRTEARRKYGIRGCGTLQRWLGKYGNGSVGKVIRVERPEEISEVQQLRQRMRQMERALADATIDLALERAYTQMACERAGIADVAEFKKKEAGRLPIRR